VTDALQARKRDPRVKVPWSGFDLINSFNAWKKSEDAGRVFIAAPDGTIVNQVTGLCWRQEVSAQVFEEAAVDLGHALAAYGVLGPARVGTTGSAFPSRSAKAAAVTAPSTEQDAEGRGSPHSSGRRPSSYSKVAKDWDRAGA
jgi:putative transposase